MRRKDGDEKEQRRTMVLNVEVARLIVENGPDKGKEFSIDLPCITIGRHQENDVCLPHDEKVSRFHGQISFSKDEVAYYYEDLNSTNGTTICDKWFRNEKVKIKHGDRIVIGGTVQLRFLTKKPGLKDWLLG